MDKTTALLLDYADGLRFDRLDPTTVGDIKRHVIDGVGCAIGGFSAPPAVIARSAAKKIQSTLQAGVFGESWKTSPDMAAFASGVMTRYLDFNDTHQGGHPSDALGGLLGLADALGSTGRDLMTSVFLHYELFGAFNKEADIRERGWDQGTFLGISIACAAAKLLGLDPDATGHAIAIATGEAPATRQSRSGALSMWKGVATANAARNGIFAALLAAEGMTGSDQPFEGRHGLWEAVCGPITPILTPPDRTDTWVNRTWFKFFPIEMNTQSAATAARQIRAQIELADVERIDIETYWRAYSEVGTEPEKWTPTTRETADHSMPYIVATVLKHGTITLEHFSAEHILNDEIRQLMAKIAIAHNEEYTRVWPGRLTTSIAATSRDGARTRIEVLHPRGHVANPMTDEELTEKFRSLCAGRIQDAQRDALLALLWNLDQQSSVGPIFDLAKQGE